MSREELEKAYLLKSDAELMEIAVSNEEEYTEEAILAARKELRKRDISPTGEDGLSPEKESLLKGIQYNVFICSSDGGNKIEAIKKGWSWPAFFFHVFWAMSKGLWKVGTGVLICLGVAGFLIDKTVGIVSGTGFFIQNLSILIHFIFGINGNKWREAKLRQQGYEYGKSIFAQNTESAVRIYRGEQYLERRGRVTEPE